MVYIVCETLELVYFLGKLFAAVGVVLFDNMLKTPSLFDLKKHTNSGDSGRKTN